MLGKNTETTWEVPIIMPSRKNKIEIHFQNKGSIFIQKMFLFFLPHILKGKTVKGRIRSIFCYALGTHS